MSFFRGKTGVCAVGANTIIQLTDYTLNIEGTAIDVTCIGNEWKQTVQGSRGWNGTINGFVDMGDSNGQRALVDEVFAAGTDGVVSDVRFEVDEGTADGYFYGSAVITAVNLNNPGNDDVVRVSMTMVGHDQLFYVEST